MTETGVGMITIAVGELYCEGCVRALHDVLVALPGVSRVDVQIENREAATGRAQVWGLGEEKTSTIIDAASRAGKPARLRRGGARDDADDVAVSGRSPLPSASGKLNLEEREELAYLRQRVATLESAIGGLVDTLGTTSVNDPLDRRTSVLGRCK